MFPFGPLLSPYWRNSIMAKTTIGQRRRIIGRWEAGASADTINITMGIPRSTVFAIIRRHRDNPMDMVDKPRSGRPRKTTAGEDRFLCRLARGRRIASSSQLRRDWATPNVVSSRTVRRRLKAHRYKSRRPIKKRVFLMHTSRCVRIKKHLIVKVHNCEMINI